MIVHDNQVYGLTKGQASPTTQEGFVTKAQPEGVASLPFNPIAVAVAMRASFVARGFSGMIDHLAGLIEQAIAHEGFALIDVLQPCVSFNKVNTFSWYKKRCYTIPEQYDPTDWQTAMQMAVEWGDKIPLGIIYLNQRQTFEKKLDVLQQGLLARQDTDMGELKKILDKFA
jgi:2-oxoglutarate ferredoxin oxidoreductase subunit beta